MSSEGKPEKPLSSARTIKCMYTNADTLTNKFLELELLVQENDYDVIAVTEVVPKSLGKQVDGFVFEGYRVISDLTGRGVCLFIRSDIEVFLLFEDGVFKPSIVCKLVLANKESFVIAVLYRSPSSTPSENIEVNTLVNKLFDQFGKERVTGIYSWKFCK